MSLFFETIKLQDGRVYHLEYHQKRVDKTREAFGFHSKFLLENHLQNLPQKGFFRLKIEYAKGFEKLTCTPYIPKNLRSFQVVSTDISYGYKYVNREEINALFQKGADDIIMAKNGLIKDTSIANIALKLNNRWYTPKTPLLEGTARARFLEQGWLEKRDLYVSDLKKCENFAIMNALIGWREIKNIEIKDDC